jgi:hypothetical protein
LIPNLISRFSLSKEAQRKANKRNAECAQAARLCYAQGATFEKVDKTIALLRCVAPLNPNLLPIDLKNAKKLIILQKNSCKIRKNVL